MDDLRLLKVLREVALRGSFSAAADALSYSQPAVSQQIARLETQAGVKLIERQPKGIRLTPAGEALVRHTERILAQLAAAHAELTEIASSARGRLTRPTTTSRSRAWSRAGWASRSPPGSRWRARATTSPCGRCAAGRRTGGSAPC